MELQFESRKVSCLQQVKWETKQQELTQEVRLTEQQPDIGSVLAAWGQCLIRGKQWHSGSMEVSGGVMAFVLYSPEDGSPSRNVQTWLPFSFRWELPQTKHDGVIQVRCRLTGMDARSASARKLIVRADVLAVAEAMVPEEQELLQLKDPPEDLQLHVQKIPVTIPSEAGEKAFTIEDTLQFTGNGPVPERMVRYHIHPEIIDRKVMSDKVVFRGTALVHTLFADSEGLLYSRDFEVPFSQDAPLDRERDPEAVCTVCPVATALEVEQNAQGGWQVKAGFACQYVVFDTPVLELIQDAYSNLRHTESVVTELPLPAMLHREESLVNLSAQPEAQGSRGVDAEVYYYQPTEEEGEIELSGSTQLLYADMEGQLRTIHTPWRQSIAYPEKDKTHLQVTAVPSGKVRSSVSPSGSEVQWDLLVDMVRNQKGGLQQLSKLDVSEPRTPDPDRPSLILRKAGTENLWTLAKLCGSTEESIRNANGLDGEPEPGKLLLIPVQ